MSFKHITSEDRVVIDSLLQEQRSNTYIARRIGVHRSTIGRELTRNQSKQKPVNKPWPARPILLGFDCRHKRGSGLAQDKYEVAATYAEKVREVKKYNRYYLPNEANKRSLARRARANKDRTRLVYGSNSWLEKYVRHCLSKEQWSPEQIAGDLRINHDTVIYPQTIYDYIYLCPDKKQLVKNLRHFGNPYRHKRGTNARIKARQAKLPSIHTRPKIIEKRRRVGDLEGDTIVGLDHRDRILTHVDRSSGECRLNLSL